MADQEFLFDPIADDLSGGDGDDTLTGGFGKDRLEGAAGNDVIDGGPVYNPEPLLVNIFNVSTGDRAVFSGFVSEYSFAAGANGAVIVTDLRDPAPDGIDTVTNVDWLEFADGNIASITLSIRKATRRRSPLMMKQCSSLMNTSRLASSSLRIRTTPIPMAIRCPPRSRPDRQTALPI